MLSTFTRFFFSNDSVIHGLGFLICFMQILRAPNNKTQTLLCVLYPDKHGFLTNQSARRVLSILLRSTKENASKFRGSPVNASESFEGFLGFLSGGQL